jgi:Flp pilus assembly protein TadD
VNWTVANNSADRTRQVWAGRQAIQARRFEPARLIAVQILVEDPNNIDALEIKALAEIERGNDEAAEQTLRAAMLVAPQVPWPYAGLAELLTRHGRVAEAEQVCRAALRADPKNADAHEKLANFLANRMKGFDAAEHYRQAIEIGGPEPRLLIRLGYSLLRLGRLDEARARLEAAAAADPNAFGPVIY